MSSQDVKQAWYFAGLMSIALLLLTLVLYQHTVQYLVGLWNQLDVGEYAHGYLVLGISGYLIFSNRQKLFAIAPCPEYRALLFLGGACMLWMLAALVDVEMLQSLALLLVLLGMAWSVLGNHAIKELAFPVLFIGFAIPIWFPLSPILQNIAADSVFSAIRILSIPAFRQDNMIILPAGTLSVEEACSGLRYLLAALTLGTLYAYMNYTSLRARLIVVLISAASAVLANIIRVFIVVYLGYATEMQHPFVEDHLYLGWYLFGGLVIVLLFIDVRLHKGRPLKETTEYDFEVEAKAANCIWKPSTGIISGAVAGLIILAAPVLVYQVNLQPVDQANSAIPGLPEKAGEWLSVETGKDDWLPVYKGAISQKQIYQKGDHRVVLYLGYYPTQAQGSEVINDLNSISNKEVWRMNYPRARIQRMGEHQMLEQLLNKGPESRQLVWFRYNIAGTYTTNKYEAKMLQVFGRLTGENWAAVVAVAAKTGDDVELTRQVLEDFILSIDVPMKNEMEKALLGAS